MMEEKDIEILTEPVAEMICADCQHPLDVAGLPAFTSIACPECHATQTVPARLGEFLLVELLGKGGMGAVYRGRDTALDRWVAVKVMLASLGANTEFVHTFRREAQAAAALNHPNVVQIYSFGVAHGQPYMVMELLEGGRLDQMMARGELLNESLVFKIATEVAEGLNAAAAIGLIHGDVKPENILIDHNGVAKIVDFGLARFRQGGQQGSQGVWGTPYYIAPEKIRGHPGDARSDIYSLGATLFHALTLKPPFDGKTPLDVVKARLKAPPPPLRQIRQDVDPEVEAVVGRMLVFEPMRRYPSYASLLADMRKVATHLKPAPVVTGSTLTKRGSKIVVTKKKGSGVMMPPVPGSLAASSTAPIPAVNKEGRRAGKGVLVVLAILVVGIVLTFWGVYYSDTKAREAAERAEREHLAALRNQAAALCSEVDEIVGIVRKSAEASRAWAKEAEVALGAMKAATQTITDTALIDMVATNATPLAAEVARNATGTIVSAMAELERLTKAMAASRTVTLTVTNAADAQVAVAAMTNYPAVAREKAAALTAILAKGEDRFKALQALKSKVVAAAAILAKEAEQLARERAEEERRKREEEARQRAAAEAQRQIKADTDLIGQTRKDNATLVQQNQFQQAAEAMTAVGNSLKTDEGKAALKIALERYRMMGDLKKMIIDGIAADVKANPDGGFRYGWLVGGVPSRDIIGADDSNVLIRGGKATWEEVSPAQMMRFIKRYTAAEVMPKRESGRHLIEAAVYVVEAGAASENAVKLASDLVREAMNADAKLAEKVKTLLPEVKVE